MSRSITESESNYHDLEQKPVSELLAYMNAEDKTVPYAIEQAMPQIEALVEKVSEKMKAGGRLFYIGAGTSGRLGILDASECPPTFGVPQDWVIGVIAGGERAIREAVEFAEDDTKKGWDDLQEKTITSADIVIGIAASGTTPYVVGAVQKCKENGITTGCITCNSDSPLSLAVDFPVEVIVGAEFITGSTRMKSGTAQKLVLNMISTVAMIQLGRVRDNRMVDMKPSNTKLVDRGVRMIQQEIGVSEDEALDLLQKYGNVRRAIDAYLKEGN